MHSVFEFHLPNPLKHFWHVPVFEHSSQFSRQSIEIRILIYQIDIPKHSPLSKNFPISGHVIHSVSEFHLPKPVKHFWHVPVLEHSSQFSRQSIEIRTFIYQISIPKHSPLSKNFPVSGHVMHSVFEFHLPNPLKHFWHVPVLEHSSQFSRQSIKIRNFLQLFMYPCIRVHL